MTTDDHEHTRIVLAAVTAVGAFIMGSALAAGEPLRIAPGTRVLGLLFTLAAFGYLTLEARTSPPYPDPILRPLDETDDTGLYAYALTVEYPDTGNTDTLLVRDDGDLSKRELTRVASDVLLEADVDSAEQVRMYALTDSAKSYADR